MSRLSFLYIYSSGSCRTHLLGNKNCSVLTPLAEEHFRLFLSFLSQIWCLKMTEPLKNYFEKLQNYILVSLMFWILKNCLLTCQIFENLQSTITMSKCFYVFRLVVSCNYWKKKKTKNTLVNRNTFKCILKKQIEIEKN